MSVVSGIMNSSATKDSASTMAQATKDSTAAQIQASQYATDAQLAAAGIGADAMLGAAGMSADAIKESAKIAAETQWAMYSQSREDQMPWLRAGAAALGQLQKKIKAGPGSFEADPGYQFRLGEGNKNITANAAATGNLASGRTLKALTAFGQDYASNEYDKFINRYYQSLAPLQSLAGLGQSTATAMGGQGITAGNSIANIYSNQGNNLANIYGQTGSGLSSLYMNSGNAIANNYMNQGNINAQGIMNQAGYSASGKIGSANAWSGALNSGFNTLASYYGNSSGSSAGASSSANYSTDITPAAYETSYGSYKL